LRERERERESERGRDLGAARFWDAGLGADLEQVEREDSGVFFVPDNRRRYTVLPHCKVWTYKTLLILKRKREKMRKKNKKQKNKTK
jgi:hypothetical protein